MSVLSYYDVDVPLTRAGFTATERAAFHVAECKQPADLTGAEWDLLERYEAARYAPEAGAA
jgi:hypothetical protein